MFRRRIKQSPFELIRNTVWPVIGWRRAGGYWARRISRLPGSIYSIAAGAAFGAAISFTPLIGFHVALAILMAWIFRANLIAAVLGTAVGNPWTFPFIWLWTYQVGVWFGIGGRAIEGKNPDFFTLFGNLVKTFLRLDLSYFFDTAWPVFGPMLVGGMVTGIGVGIGTYFSIRLLVETYRRGRRRIARKKLSKIHTTQGVPQDELPAAGG